MDFETVSAADFGRSLMGLGVNLLSRDVRALAAFLSEVFGLSVHRLRPPAQRRFRHRHP